MPHWSNSKRSWTASASVPALTENDGLAEGQELCAPAMFRGLHCGVGILEAAASTAVAARLLLVGSRDRRLLLLFLILCAADAPASASGAAMAETKGPNADEEPLD